MSNDADDQTSDENRSDFELLRRQQSDHSLGRTTLSANLWPLRLNPISLDHYILGDTIGTGSYAEVRECIDSNTLQRCAVKIIDKNHLRRQAPRALANQMQEIRLLKRLRHANIISLIGCRSVGPKVYIFLEHCTFVLNDLLLEQDGGRFHCSQIIRALFEELANGIGYLHSIGIVHRDIKPQNLLINNCGTLKIIDFGVSQILSMWTRGDTCSNNEGSPLFQAPEVVSGQPEYPGFKVDIWSAGVTLFLMLFGRYPFNDEALLGLYDKILSERLIIPADIEIPNKLVAGDLLAFMLDKNHSTRATIDDVLEHPWLKMNSSIGNSLPSEPKHSDLIELTQRRRLLSSSNRPDGNRAKDIYESMSVIPYLYNHHFPHLRVHRVDQSNEITPMRTDSLESTRSALGSPTGSPALVNPHEIVSTEPIEWGTAEQYNLLKIPLIRANRLKPPTRPSSPSE